MSTQLHITYFFLGMMEEEKDVAVAELALEPARSPS
jgi:hypothetical protein